MIFMMQMLVCVFHCIFIRSNLFSLDSLNITSSQYLCRDQTKITCLSKCQCSNLVIFKHYLEDTQFSTTPIHLVNASTWTFRLVTQCLIKLYQICLWILIFNKYCIWALLPQGELWEINLWCSCRRCSC